MKFTKALQRVRPFSTKFPEHAMIQQKPQLSQFKFPLYNTFLIASSVYIFLNTVWYKLEHDEREKELTIKAKLIEDEIQQLVDSKKVEFQEIVQQEQKSWWKVW